MKRTCIVVFLFLAISAGYLRGQGTFEKKIDFDHASGFSVAQSSDGSFFLAGRYVDFNQNYFTFIILIKTDETGSILWAKKIIGTHSFDHNDKILISATRDGGAALVTSLMLDYTNAETQCIKFDKDGLIEWSSMIRDSSFLANSYHGEFIMEIPDSSYVILSTVGTLHSAVTKINNKGNILWSKTFFGTKSNDMDESLGVVTSDSSIVVAGLSFLSPGITLVEISGSGKMLWQRYDTTTLDVSPTGMTKTSDQGFAVCGTVQEGLYVVKFDATGSFLWDISVNILGPIACSGIIEAANGELYVCGRFSVDDSIRTGPDSLVIVSLTRAGELHRAKYFAIPNSSSGANGIIATRDNGIAVVGSIGGTSTLFLKLDTLIEGCYLQNTLASTRSIGKTGESNIIMNSEASVRDTMQKLDSTGFNYNVTDICSNSYVQEPITRQISPSPNPLHSNESLTIHSDNLPQGKYELRISDLLGNILVSEPVSVSGGKQDIMPDVSRLAAGAYVVELRSEDEKTYLGKFVKE